MSSQRLSLSSSVFVGRIKKYDSYQHNPRTSQRAIAGSQVINEFVAVVKKPARAKVETTSLATVIHNKFLGEQATYPVKKSVLVERPKNSPELSKPHPIALHAIKHTPALTRAVIAEQFEDSQAPRITSRRPRSKLQVGMYSFGILVFLFASTVSVQSMLANRQAKEQIQVLGEQTITLDFDGVPEGTGTEPSEVVPSAQALANYRVEPEAPRYLRIPSLQVFARIKSLGVDQTGAVAAPTNLNDVGWYNGSAKPGNAIGASLLQGHVSGWTAPGVFKKLNKLAVGARFEVEKGSGEKVLYEVTKSESIPMDQINMSKILSSDVAGEHDMKLMTCAGKYDASTKEYSERFVVYAKVLK